MGIQAAEAVSSAMPLGIPHWKRQETEVETNAFPSPALEGKLPLDWKRSRHPMAQKWKQEWKRSARNRFLHCPTNRHCDQSKLGLTQPVAVSAMAVSWCSVTISAPTGAIPLNHSRDRTF